MSACEEFDIHRIDPVKKVIVKPFLMDTGNWFQVASIDQPRKRFGGELCVFGHDGDVRVSDADSLVNSSLYFTDYGPCFGHAAVRSLPCDEAYRTACRRLTAVRDTLEFHNELIESQRVWCASSDVAQYKEALKQLVQCEYGKLNGTEEELQREYAYAPRVKRRLYIDAYEEAANYNGGLYHHPQVVEPRLVVSLKTGEWSIHDKNDRNIVNFGPHASLVGGFLMDSVKAACSTPYESKGCRAWFVKSPSGVQLQAAFERLIECEKRVEYCYYSDDSCLAFQCQMPDGSVRPMFMNVDISACDGSNFQPVFDVAKEVMADSRFQTAVDKTFDYLRRPVTFITSDGRATKLAPSCMRMYSGSVLTTFINNVANMLIFLSLVKLLDNLFPVQPPTESEFADLLTRAAREAGYKVTRSPASDIPESLQFLKRSPSIVNSIVCPWMNIGTCLRGFGTIRGDLPGSSKRTLIDRANAHNTGIVLSRVHDGDHSISRAFQIAFHHSKPIFDRVDHDYHGGIDLQCPFIPDENIALRYGLSPCEIAELARQISVSVVGQRISSPTIDRIISVDYGVEWVE